MKQSRKKASVKRSELSVRERPGRAAQPRNKERMMSGNTQRAQAISELAASIPPVVAPGLQDPEKIFGSEVFGYVAMEKHLPKDVFKALKHTIEKGQPLDPKVADVVASAMKDWAMAKGATHYAHVFQPLTGFTAEKHDSFLGPDNN